MRDIGFLLPRPVLRGLRGVRNLTLGTWYGGAGRWCPVCRRSSRRFLPFGREVVRQDARCPHCTALERHRMVWLYLTHRTDLFDGRPKRVLHVAPEQCLEERLRARLGAGYLTADLLDPHAMEKMDVTDIGHPDESFDAIYCSHVLEHVPDDRRAMREFHRVLKRGGWAILLVPITADRTMEDATVTDPAERLRLYGQADHVRRYGPDYVERLRDAGFDVAVSHVPDLIGRSDAIWMGLATVSGHIYHCRKAVLRSRPRQ